MKIRVLVVVVLLAAVFPALAQEDDDLKRRADQIWNQATALQDRERYNEAVTLLLRNKELFTKTGDYYYAAVANRLGSLYLMTQNYVRAEAYYLEAKTIYERIYGKTHADYIASLNNLGDLYITTGAYAKAVPYYLEVKIIVEHTLGKDHSDYAMSLTNLGGAYTEMGDYAKAEPYLLEARTVYEKALGKNHADYASSLNNLGFLYSKMGAYAKAEQYLLDANAVFERVLGKNHPDYAQSLNDLGNLYAYMGDNARSGQYYLQAKTLRERTLGKNHPDYAVSVTNLGLLYHDMGDYAKAESYLLEAKAVYEKAFGKNHPDYAMSLVNLGLLYLDMGDYVRAEPCYQEAKAVYEKTLGKSHPDYATSLTNLGNLYKFMGDYAKAEPYYQEAKTVRERALGKDHISYAGSLNSLGWLYYCMDDYAKAEPYYLEARTVYEKAVGKNHPDYAGTLSNLGILYAAKGEYAKAEPLFLEAKAVEERTLGKNHPYYALSLNSLGALYQNMRNYAKAEAYNKELCELIINSINQNFTFMSEQQRGLYLQTVSWNFESSYSLSRLHPVETVNGLNYTNTLFSKGLLLRTTNAVRDTIYSSGNKALIEKFEQLGKLHQQISALRQKEDANEAYLQSLETQADALDKELTRASAEFRDLKADIAMRWQAVRDSLRPGEAAIEFVSFQVYDKVWTDTVQYAALVLKKDSRAPVWVPLCNEEDLRDILSKASGRRRSIDQVKFIYDTFGLKLYALVWEPLEKELSGVKTIYYSPSGLLHKISLNAIPVEDDSDKLLADKYDLNLVSSTREVARLDRSASGATRLGSAVLYGGLDYDTDEKTMRVAAQAYKKETSAPVISYAPPEGRVGIWEMLSDSREEAMNIKGYLDRKRVPLAIYTGSNGNEESFKQLGAKKTELIHIATHGFSLPDVARKHDDRKQEQRGGVLRDADNPLLRSGLLLSGGNHAWKDEPVEGVEDGILYAVEIAGLNLLGAKLVVMSACESGLGDVNNGEGVFGLQRAFKLAGVETLIMSLWKAADESTAILMSTFYQEWLFSGKSKRAAFKEAQKQVRAKYPDPFFWAVFVMMD